MKVSTFHFLAEAARRLGGLDLGDLGLDPEMDPVAYFMHSGTTPSIQMVERLVRAYDENGWKVKPPGAREHMDIRQAVEFMEDSLVDSPSRGRPVESTIKDLRPLKDLLTKHGYTQRQLSVKADCYPSVLTSHLNYEVRITNSRLEQILEGAQRLFSGNPEALKELRQLEKKL